MELHTPEATGHTTWSLPRVPVTVPGATVCAACGGTAGYLIWVEGEWRGVRVVQRQTGSWKLGEWDPGQGPRWGDPEMGGVRRGKGLVAANNVLFSRLDLVPWSVVRFQSSVWTPQKGSPAW